MNLTEMTTTLPNWIAWALDEGDCPTRARRTATIRRFVASEPEVQEQWVAFALRHYTTGRLAAEAEYAARVRQAVAAPYSALPRDPFDAAQSEPPSKRKSRVFSLGRYTSDDRKVLEAWAARRGGRIRTGLLAIVIQLAGTPPDLENWEAGESERAS